MMELSSVGYAYAKGGGVDSVTTRFREGELVSLTGPNGSGKSTLMKLMARALDPQRGEVRLLDRPLAAWDRREFARETGYLPQEPEWLLPMRAIDVVLSGRAPFLERFRWESKEDYALAEQALADCDASHLADRLLEEMSGGERKRVFLARVLAGQPRLILLDEPLAALDLEHMQRFVEMLRTIVDVKGSTVVFISHDMNWSSACADRMLVMNGGRLVLEGPPREVMRPEVMLEHFNFRGEALQSDSGRSWIVPSR